MSENGNSPEPAVEQQEAVGNGAKKSKADKRKEKKQKQKQNKQQRRQQQDVRLATKAQGGQEDVKEEDDEKIIVEYVSAPLDFEGLAISEPSKQADEDEAMGNGLGYALDKPQEDPFSEFKRVFQKFASAEQVTGLVPLGEGEEEEGQQGDKDSKAADQPSTADKDSDDADDEEDGEGRDKKLTKKQRKQLALLKIAQLKQTCERPDVVEVWDVTSQDPELLVYLKAYRNTIPVPRHWSQKRKYLQGKRGLEKPPFKLPDFIEATGIGTMRQAYQDKEESKKLKQKARERMQPKMGRMDIDYQVLHDAFFKYQTRPKLTPLGDMYYEGKEFEARIENAKPGILSSELKGALGMSDNTPPPWLINMQRYGPPPSYPNLRIAGLNAPIPPGCQFGYHAGGWGKPPVDEEGNPLYGDVFGVHHQDLESDGEVDKASKWGELEAELEESSEEEEEEEEEEQDEEALEDGIASGLVSGLTTGGVSGLASGIASSLPSGIETPDVSINLRKGNESAEPPRLYTVLEQKAAPLGQTTLLGTEHVYVIPGQEKGKRAGQPGRPGATDVEITLTPEEMEGLDDAGIKALYEQKLAEARASERREDFSDMVAERAAQQKRKMQQKADAAKKQKTGKDFKF